MKADKNNSWKEKIDPAFDDLIKAYLDYVKHANICITDRYERHKRYLFVDDESLKMLGRKGYPPLLKAFKTNPKNLKELMNDTIAIGASSDSKLIWECFTNMEKLLSKNEKIKSKSGNKNKYENALRSNIMSMIKGLTREDSRNYYKKHLGIDSSPEEVKPFVKGKVQKKTQVSIEMLKDILCLMYQTGVRGYGNLQDESFNDKRINKVNFIYLVMQQIYDSISRMTYKKSLAQLLEEARNNDESLYKAIHLDKTLFDEDWVRKRIRKAFYSGDSAFFKELGKEIKKPPIPLRWEFGSLLLILVKFWPIGLSRLEVRELVGLLESCGFTIKEDIQIFRRYIGRLKKENVLIDLDKIITIQKT